MTASRVHATRTKHRAQRGIHERLPLGYNHSLVFPEFTDFDPWDTQLQNSQKSGGPNSTCRAQVTKPIPIPGAQHIRNNQSTPHLAVESPENLSTSKAIVPRTNAVHSAPSSSLDLSNHRVVPNQGGNTSRFRPQPIIQTQ